MPDTRISRDSAWRSPTGQRNFASFKGRLTSMRHPLYRRLQQLEESSFRALKHLEWRDKEADKAKATERIRLFLRLRSVEQHGGESLAGAWARALEITTGELRRLLTAGIDPIHQYLADRDVYETIQTREAAGTIPGGSMPAISG